MQIQALSIEFPDGLAESHAISRHLKGYNLEMTGACHDGLLADRLRNPKFFGPADLFGVPPGWHGGSVSHCRLVPGLGWSGSEALLLTPPCSLRQGGLHVAAGEELEIQVAAKTPHAPVKLSLAVKTEAIRSTPLANPRGAVLHFADCRNGEDVQPLKEPAGAILPPRAITPLEFEAQA